MKLISRNDLAQTVPSRWKEVYFPHGTDRQKAIGEALDKLATPIDPDEVDKIIGNTSWTIVPKCDQCSHECARVVEVGEPAGYESNTANLCLPCLAEAIKLFGLKRVVVENDVKNSKRPA